MNSSNKQRDYLFDNYKVLLIFLVVLGHFIEPCYKNNEFLYTLKWIIVSFHMPAFIFISGYFSKRNLSGKALITKLGIPYLAYEVIYYFLYIVVLHKETKLYLTMPKFSLWYLLALFIWRAVTPLVKKIPHYIIFSVIAGLLIGCSDMKDNFLSLPRVIVFYPYFLAGTVFERKLLTKLRTQTNQCLAFAGVLVFTLFFGLFSYHIEYSPKIFYGRYNYDFLGQTVLEGMICRLICYGIGFAVTIALMLLVSEKRTVYSYIGGRTMAIYLFHGLTYSYLKHCTDLLHNINTMTESILLLAFCALLVAVFSAPPFTSVTNAVASVQLPDLPVRHSGELTKHQAYESYLP